MALKKSAASTIKNIYNNARQKYSAKLAGSKSLLYNKYVLYATFLICFMTLLGWLFSKEFVPVIVFVLAGYLTSFFSKNMIVILVISFVVSNVTKLGARVVMEGMEGKKDDSEKKKSDKKKEGMVKKKEGMVKKKEGMEEEHENENENENENEMDETRESIDEEPCTTDSDCNDGKTCDASRFVCIAK